MGLSWKSFQDIIIAKKFLRIRNSTNITKKFSQFLFKEMKLSISCSKNRLLRSIIWKIIQSLFDPNPVKFHQIFSPKILEEFCKFNFWMASQTLFLCKRPGSLASHFVKSDIFALYLLLKTLNFHTLPELFLKPRKKHSIFPSKDPSFTQNPCPLRFPRIYFQKSRFLSGVW